MTKTRVVVRQPSKTAPEEGAVFRKGVRELRFLSWRELQEYKPHPMNYKIHPKGQRNSLNAALKTVGWAGAILVNVTTGHFLDGHMRAEEAIKSKEKEVPVLFGEWTEHEELVVLQTYDPLGAAFQFDVAAFESLTKVASQQGKNLAQSLRTSEEKNSIDRLLQASSKLAKDLLSGGGEQGDTYQPVNFNLPKPSRTKPLTAKETIRQIGVDDDLLEEETELAEEAGRVSSEKGSLSESLQEGRLSDDFDGMGQSSDEYSEAVSEAGSDGTRSSDSPIFTSVRLRSDVIFEPAEYFDPEEGLELENVFGIPALHPDVDDPTRYVQAEDAPTGVVWDRSKKTMQPSSIYCISSGPNFPPEKNGQDEEGNEIPSGFLAFHTEDQRFVGTWNNVIQYAKKLEEQRWKGVFEPEFSVTSALPSAVSLFNLYRSRYLARWWQEYYLPIIPLLRSYGWLETSGYPSLLPCMTIRTGTPVVGCQARNMAKEDRVSKMRVLSEMFEYAVDVIGSQVIVVYGGKDCEKYLKGSLYKPSQVEYVLTKSFTAARRDRQ